MSNQQAALAIVFADVCRSTQLFEEHGNVRARSIVGRALALLTEVTEQHGGTVVKTIGDEVMCTFQDLSQAVQATFGMHPVIKEDPQLATIGLSIKVGLHYGDVVIENNDVYGDAVNVAARMVGMAKADQIITTRSTIEAQPSLLSGDMRSLGHVHVRGKLRAIEIVELIWQQDTTDLTLMHGPLQVLMPDTQSRVVLHFQNRSYEVGRNRPPFTLGRDDQNDLVIAHYTVSRTHASIEFASGMFVLVDRSTNGTYLQIEGEEAVYLHRDRIRLRGEGVFCLGRELGGNEADLIRFTCFND